MLFLFLDVKKAFYRIHWEFEKLAFQGNIYSAINALYATPSARVLANRVLSRPFTITNSMRQGCTVSPLIFAFVMKPLAEAIRSHAEIKGVEIAGSQHKINLFANDVILAITDVEQSLSPTTEII